MATLRPGDSAMSIYMGPRTVALAARPLKRPSPMAQSNVLGLFRLSQSRGQLTQRVQSFLPHPLIVPALCVQYRFHVWRHSCQLQWQHTKNTGRYYCMTYIIHSRPHNARRHKAAYIIWNIEDAHTRSIPWPEPFYNLSERDSRD